MHNTRAARLVNTRVVLGLGLLALLATGAYFALQRASAVQDQYARLAYLTTQQVAQVHRIARLGMLMASVNDSLEFDQTRSQLGISLRQLERTHQLLQHGDLAADIGAVPNQATRYADSAAELDSALQNFIDVAAEVQRSDWGALSVDSYAYLYLTTHGPRVLEPMLDAWVAEYEQLNRDAIRQRAKLERYYWLGTLLLLLLEAILLFIPLEKRIRDVIAGLESTVDELESTRERYVEARKKAESASEAKSQFLATMTHELRTPMNGVLGMSELLQGTRLNTKQSEYVQIIVDSSESLLTIINDILDFSRLEAGKVALEQIPFNLEQAAYDVLALLAPRCQNKTLQLILDFAPDLPRNFIGDPARIRQILFNLIGNASKFTEQGYIQVSISVEVDEDHCGQISIHVEDTGIGIAQDKVDRLFRSFTQADSSTTRKYGGTGLGLTITRELVTLMGGCIEVDSALGKGSVFTVELTLKLAAQIDEMPVPHVTIRHVLLLEPNDIYRDLVVDRLARVGVEATPIESSSEAHKRLVACAEHGGMPQLVVVSQDALLDPQNKWRKFSDKPIPASVAWIVLSNGAENTSRFRDITQHLQGYATYMQKPFTNYQLYFALNTSVQQPEISTLHANIVDEDSTDFTLTHSKRGEILLVEDHHANQKFASLLLNKMGYNVDIAEDGSEALRMWRNNEYDLILMDCLMPNMDGYEASVKIRQEEASNARTPIIALTANASERDRERCRQSGMDEILTKPYRKQELADVLDRWLHDEPSFITITHNTAQNVV